MTDLFPATTIAGGIGLSRNAFLSTGHQWHMAGHPSELTRPVALVGEQAAAAGARAAMTHETSLGWRGGLLGQPLPPQLLHAGPDCRKIVSCSGMRHQTLRMPP
jgi:hypothetical protein